MYPPPLPREDIGHAWLLICQDDLSTAVSAAASVLMTLEHQDIEAIAHRAVELLQVDDAAIGGSC
jgi:hypothetical protein